MATSCLKPCHHVTRKPKQPCGEATGKRPERELKPQLVPKLTACNMAAVERTLHKEPVKLHHQALPKLQTCEQMFTKAKIILTHQRALVHSTR